MEVITYPNPKCATSPTAAHWYVRLSGSNIWVCKYCWTPVWQPPDFTSTTRFSLDIRRHGLQKAYMRQLSGKPKVKEAIGFLLAMKQFRLDSNFDIANILATAHSIASAKASVNNPDATDEDITLTELDIANLKGGLVYG